jgi:serine protease
MPRLLLLVIAAVLVLAAPAAAAEYRPGEVIVKYEDGTRGVLKQTDDGNSVHEEIAELHRDPDVVYAVPNYVARAAQMAPNDPGYRRQWNLSTTFGINMPEAWQIAAQRGAPGAKGALVAVLDSGVAYQNRGRFKRAPDLRKRTFTKGYDFIDNDRFPNDVYGHGTHVAGTIAQTTNNRRGTAGIAYGARIMPLRVLDSQGSGDSAAIARAIRYAARRRADVINLSLEFPAEVRAAEIPDVLAAIRYARRKGSVIVAAAGNQADLTIAYPARASSVIAVGATTIRGCEADYSNAGDDIDVVAPGGGTDAPNADNPYDAANCKPDLSGPSIYQQTFIRGVRRFGLPGGYEGTSMAAPHVSAIAALIIATRRVGRNPRPQTVEDQIERTVRDAGPPGWDTRYGWGLVDAAAALR